MAIIINLYSPDLGISTPNEYSFDSFSLNFFLLPQAEITLLLFLSINCAEMTTDSLVSVLFVTVNLISFKLFNFNPIGLFNVILNLLLSSLSLILYANIPPAPDDEYITLLSSTDNVIGGDGVYISEIYVFH